jgi:Flp pilus assembly pilin Flp
LIATDLGDADGIIKSSPNPVARDLHLPCNPTVEHIQSYLPNDLMMGPGKLPPEILMSFLTRIFSRIIETKRSQHGQTMTEYVLIIAAIAVAGYVAYQGLETGINGIITKVTASLNAA